VLSFLGLVAWVCYAPLKERIVVLTLIFTSFALGAGKLYADLQFLFDSVPVFRIVRFPEKFFFITFALIVFAVVQGLDAVHHFKDSQRNFPVVVLFESPRFMGDSLFFLPPIPRELVEHHHTIMSRVQEVTASVATTTASIYF